MKIKVSIFLSLIITTTVVLKVTQNRITLRAAYTEDHTEVETRSEITRCIFPQVDQFDPSIMKLAGLDKGPIDCDDYGIPEITYIDGLYIRVNASKLKAKSAKVRCWYRNITRTPYNDLTVTFSKWSPVFTQSIRITEEHEFLYVRCLDSESKRNIVSKAYYSLVPKRSHWTSFYNAAAAKRLMEFEPKETLSVIGVCLDGLPRHQMLRAMPETLGYLKDLGSFDFTMQGQVADNTLRNYLSLFTAHNFNDVRRWWSLDKLEDMFGWIWHDFEQAGYRTLYTEDDSKRSGFFYGGGRFLFPPTSYWNRALQLAMDKDPGFTRRYGLCNGKRSTSDSVLNYLMTFLDRFSSHPVSGWAMLSAPTHDDIANAKSLDLDILKFFKTLEEKGHLNKSLVIFFL
ncbi:hypothetical protein EGW08_021118 [Elysia chlorotica]|uniref:Uncharacterized protein n=1 Tax=Elysia chlorotica TaxID=188477 RepID=A0A433SPP5_ELYCH|nr:hypothetical protein EGW08_021118 [Elysia chlorotica]